MEAEKKTFYCRKCMKYLPDNAFYKALDGGLIDSNMKLGSTCKKCIQTIYDDIYSNTNSLEKSIHRVCTSLNIKYSNEAVDALKKQIETLLENGKSVNAIIGMYLSKLISINPSMDKSAKEDMTYRDVGTIFVDKVLDSKKPAIPKEVIDFWGDDLIGTDIEFLEKEYTKFKETHSTETRAEVVLLKEVCFTLLDIKKARLAGDDTQKKVAELQNLMKNLAISPNATNTTNSGKGQEAFGLWIQDIEQNEPAQWLKSNPLADMYRDIGNTDEYFQKYFVRPLKNFIMGSKDFNIEDSNDEFSIDEDDNLFTEEET